MSPAMRDAVNVVKGEMAGDEMLWDKKYVDPKTGVTLTGVWKSYLERDRKPGSRRET